MRRFASILLVFLIFLGQIIPHFVQPVLAQTIPSILQMPSSGAVLTTSSIADHLMIKGLKVNLDNPFQFDFIMDTGDSGLEGHSLQFEAQKLMRYFLTALTVPEEDIWVNLSPVESDRIVPESLGQTRMGRDMLALDYLLKQMTASLLYPEGETGKVFWNDIYQKAQHALGSTDIPVETFHKVWIVPERAIVYEEGAVGYVVDTHLKVMLEEDYLALQTYQKGESEDKNSVRDMGLQSLSDIVLPILEKEVNEGEHFAPLRQIYHALILSEWYKKKFKQSLLAQVYVDQSKIGGDKHGQETVVKEIYEKYLDNMRQGSYELIKEEVHPVTEEIQLRKYFSGGFVYPTGSSSITTDKGFFKKAVDQANTLLLVSSLVVFSSLATVSSVSAQTAPDVVIKTQVDRQEMVAKLYDKYPNLRLEERLFDFANKDFENDDNFSMQEFVTPDNVEAMLGYLVLVGNESLNKEFIDLLLKKFSFYFQVNDIIYEMPENPFAIQIVRVMVENRIDHIWRDFSKESQKFENALTMLQTDTPLHLQKLTEILQVKTPSSEEPEENQFETDFLLLVYPFMSERDLSLDDVVKIGFDPVKRLEFIQDLMKTANSYHSLRLGSYLNNILAETYISIDQSRIDQGMSEKDFLTQGLGARTFFIAFWNNLDSMSPQHLRYFWKVFKEKLESQNLSLKEFLNGDFVVNFFKWFEMMRIYDLEDHDFYTEALFELDRLQLDRSNEVYKLPQEAIFKRSFWENPFSRVDFLKKNQDEVLEIKEHLESYFNDDSFFETHSFKLTTGFVFISLTLGIDNTIAIFDQAQLQIGKEAFLEIFNDNRYDDLLELLDNSIIKSYRVELLPDIIHAPQLLKDGLKVLLPHLEEGVLLEDVIDSWSRRFESLLEKVESYKKDMGDDLFQLWHSTSEQQARLLENLNSNSNILSLRAEHLGALKELLGDDVVSSLLIPLNVSLLEFDSLFKKRSGQYLRALVSVLQLFSSEEDLRQHFVISHKSIRSNEEALSFDYIYFNIDNRVNVVDLLSYYIHFGQEYPQTMKVLYSGPSRNILSWFSNMKRLGLEKTEEFIEYLIAVYSVEGSAQAISLLSSVAENPIVFESYKNFNKNTLHQLDREYQIAVRNLLSKVKDRNRYYSLASWVDEASKYSPKQIQKAIDLARNFLGQADLNDNVILLVEFIFKYGLKNIKVINDEMKQVLGEDKFEGLINDDFNLFLNILNSFSQSYEVHRGNLRGKKRPVFLKSFGSFGRQVIQWSNETAEGNLAELYVLDKNISEIRRFTLAPKNVFFNVLIRIAIQGGKSDMFATLPKEHPYLFNYDALGRPGAIGEIIKGLEKLPHPRTFLDRSLGGNPIQKNKDFVAYSLHALAVVRILDPEVMTRDYYEYVRFKVMSGATIKYDGIESFNANTLFEFGSELLKELDYSILALMAVQMHEFGHYIFYSLLDRDGNLWSDAKFFNRRISGESAADSVSFAGLELLGWGEAYEDYMNLLFNLDDLTKLKAIDVRGYHSTQRYQWKLALQAFKEKGVALDSLKFYRIYKKAIQNFTSNKSPEVFTTEVLLNYLDKSPLAKRRWLQRPNSYPKGVIPKEVIHQLIDYDGQYLEYKVKKWDSLSLIAYWFSYTEDLNITVEAIVEYNNNIPDRKTIPVGDIIRIPLSASSGVGMDLNFNTIDQSSTPVGGIDLSNKNWELIIQNVDGVSCQKDDQSGCMNIPFSPEQIKAMQANIPGLVPIIINIQPVSNLPFILGLQDSELPEQQAVNRRDPLLAAKY